MTDQTPQTPMPEPEKNQAPLETPVTTPAPAPEPAPVPAQPVSPQEMKMTSSEMAATILGGIFLSIAVPLTLWAAWNQIYPAKAKQAIKVFWIIIIVEVVLVCCAAIAYGTFFAAIVNSAIGDYQRNGSYTF